MNWFFLALAAPALWSVCNFIDKFLLSKYFKDASAGSLIIFSSLFAIFVLPIALVIEPNVLNISFIFAGLLIINAMISFLGIIFYLYAMQKDEASIVVPLFQLVPVFSYILALVIIGEKLTVLQILAGLLIIFGSVALSLDLNEKKIKLKTNILFLMTACSFLLAIGGVIFKFVAIQSTFWISTFWTYVGLVVFGILLLLFVKSYRESFLSVIRASRIPVIGLNALNETLNTIAALAFSFATLLAPVALVSAVGGVQPFFVFFYGVLITMFFPHLGAESLVKKHLLQKIGAIIVIFIGSYFLNTNG